MRILPAAHARAAVELVERNALVDKSAEAKRERALARQIVEALKAVAHQLLRRRRLQRRGIW